ncbi:MAG TPA: acyl-ACP thioesterase domain-containing protein [Solirubrobacteraceae bacterium]|nr:acyl-ACP thioesterase domain-containing protein [Solirubrobacteraceae bacterium]
MQPVKLNELVPWPERGRLFSERARARLADCAPTGRLRLDALARWAQDVAYADAVEAGLSRRAAWVVRRTRMRVDRFPRFGEEFTLATFCSGLGRMWAERRTSMTPVGEAAGTVEVVSLWVHLDPLSGRPTKLTADEIAMWGESAEGRTVNARLRHPSPDGVADSFRWQFRNSELDLAGHVNNAAYLTPVEEELLQDSEPESIDVEIEYRSAAQAGEMRVLRHGARRWIVGPDGETYASIIIALTPTQMVPTPTQEV